MKLKFILFFIFFTILAVTVFSKINFNEEVKIQNSKYLVDVNITNPNDVIETLNEAILQAKEEGHYKCCINPACTMCYLGHWKFEKGTCYCDDAIKEGRDEDVCPECKKGLEFGLCSSTENNEIYEKNNL